MHPRPAFIFFKPVSLKLTKTALSWCLGKGSLGIRGSKRRPWLEIKRVETERPYLSYQLFSLRRAADGPTDDVRDTLTGSSFYDIERIRFTGEGLEAAYRMLYPRDKRVITPEVLDTCGIEGLAAIWLDQGIIKPNKRGVLSGKYSLEEAHHIKNAFRSHGIAARITPRPKPMVLFDPKVMPDLKVLLTPYVHRTMLSKLMLRKPRTARDGSKSAAR